MLEAPDGPVALEPMKEVETLPCSARSVEIVLGPAGGGQDLSRQLHPGFYRGLLVSPVSHPEALRAREPPWCQPGS